jgi:hypothetical protein
VADTTFPVALAALRAECGEPAFCHGTIAVWRRGGVRVGLMQLGADLAIDAAGGDAMAAWVLAGDAPLTPLDVAVRDAGAWLRGRG